MGLRKVNARGIPGDLFSLIRIFVSRYDTVTRVFSLYIGKKRMSRVAIVTGANRGIGLASVRILLKKFNGIVYLTSRNRERGEQAVQSLNAEGLRPEFQVLDIGDDISVDNLRDFMVKRHGGLDVCIHNAGILFPKEDTTPYAERARATVKTNYFDAVKVCDTILPVMKSGGRFVILSASLSLIALQGCRKDVQKFFTSNDLTQDDLNAKMMEFVEKAQTGSPKEFGFDEHAYGMSKLGVNAFTRLTAKRVNDYGQNGILINCCCPGWVRTSMGGENAAFSPDQGAQIPVMLAMLPDSSSNSDPNGEFYRRRKIIRWYE